MWGEKEREREVWGEKERSVGKEREREKCGVREGGNIERREEMRERGR